MTNNDSSKETMVIALFGILALALIIFGVVALYLPRVNEPNPTDPPVTNTAPSPVPSETTTPVLLTPTEILVSSTPLVSTPTATNSPATEMTPTAITTTDPFTRISLENAKFIKHLYPIVLLNEARIITFSPNGKYLAAYRTDYSGIQIFAFDEVHHPYFLKTLTHAAVTSIAFSPDGQFLTSASNSSYQGVAIYRISDGGIQAKLSDLEYAVQSIAYSPDDQWIATTGKDGILLWRLDDRSLAHTLTTGRADRVLFTPDSQTLISAYGHSVLFWDVNTGEQTKGWEKGSFLALSPDGEYIALGMDGGSVLLYRVSDGKQMSSFSGVLPANMPNFINNCAAFSWDSKILAFSTGDGPYYIRLYSVPDGKFIVELGQTISQPITSLAFSPDGSYLVSLGTDNILRFWGVP